jgi:hypothetical protein
MKRFLFSFNLILGLFTAINIQGQAGFVSRSTDVACGQTLAISDVAGPNANYANFDRQVFTYCPDQCTGMRVSLQFTSINTEAGFDAVFVYPGPSINVNQAPIVFTGVNPTGFNTPIVSFHPTGCLTVALLADGSVPAGGFTGTVTAGNTDGSACNNACNLVCSENLTISLATSCSAYTVPSNLAVIQGQGCGARTFTPVGSFEVLTLGALLNPGCQTFANNTVTLRGNDTSNGGCGTGSNLVFTLRRYIMPASVTVNGVLPQCQSIKLPLTLGQLYLMPLALDLILQVILSVIQIQDL